MRIVSMAHSIVTWIIAYWMIVLITNLVNSLLSTFPQLTIWFYFLPAISLVLYYLTMLIVFTIEYIKERDETQFGYIDYIILRHVLFTKIIVKSK